MSQATLLRGILFLTSLAFLLRTTAAVILPPLLSTQQSNLYLTEGQTEVVLECNLDVGDAPVRFRWLKQYKFVTAELGHAYRTNKKVHLALHRITRDHGGLYECEAVNDAGTDAVEIYVHVQPGDSSYQSQMDDNKIETDAILAEIATSLNDVLAEGNCECDLMFLLHASPDAPDQTLGAQANFVYTIAQSIISEKIRVAIMTYSDYVNPKLNFGSGTDECALRDAFKDLSHEKWPTRIQPVLSSAYKKMKKSKKECKVIFLQIFGSLGTDEAKNAASSQILSNGIKLFILEATNAPIPGVKNLASKRGDGKHHHWRIPLKMWKTIVPFMNYMKEELSGCMDVEKEKPDMCVKPNSNCTQSNQCSGIGMGCVQGVCKSLDCHKEPEGAGCCTESGDFWCGDVTMECKSEDIVCDGKFQCMNGLDEEGCWIAPCPVNMVRCQSSVLCMTLYELCDGEPHCPSAEDEDPNFCRSHPCPVDRPYRCKSGKCIGLEKLCDGMFKDCEDGDDEHLDYCNGIHECPASRPFKCDYGVCIPETKECDGAYNCLDALDELLCNERGCPASRPFKCADGKCVELDLVCNGIIDACSDGTDEKNCDEFICPASKPFKCHNGKCIDGWLECDKRDDCGDKSDELYCNHTTTTSYTSSTQLPATAICSDVEFYCSSGVCLNRSMVCDGRKHCEDGDDEDLEICKDFLCPNERPHRCPDFTCVMILICDGVNDCSDGSDEEDCPDTDHTHVEDIDLDEETHTEGEPEVAPEPEPEPEPETEPESEKKDHSSTMVEKASTGAASTKGKSGSSAHSIPKSLHFATSFALATLSLAYSWLR